MTDVTRATSSSRWSAVAGLLFTAALATACSSSPPPLDASGDAFTADVATSVPDASTSEADAAQSEPDADSGVGDASQQLGVYAPDETVGGRSMAQWGAAWWEWALSIPRQTNPMLGGACDQNQPSDMFFLAGNTGGTETRACTVPAGRPLFFPILNAMYHTRPEITCGSTAASVQDSAQRCWDLTPPSSLLLEIDGVSVSNLEAFEAYTGPIRDTQPSNPDEQVFPPGGPIGANSCGVPVGSDRPAAGNGFWMMVRPLPPGNHTVHFAGTIQLVGQAPFTLDVTYNLTIAP